MSQPQPAEAVSAGDRAAIVSARVRGRAVWSLALFTAALPVAFLGGGPDQSESGGRALLGSVFWGSGAVMAMLAAWTCIRNWPVLPRGTRWLGLLPAAGAGFIGLLLAIAVTIGGGPP